jgi:hypothetical protein
MKLTKISGKLALIALAAACLLAAPALSMPMGDGTCRQGHGAMFDLKNNLTAEEMDNMTLGELKELQKESMNQTHFCPAGGKNCTQDGKGSGDRMGRDGLGCQMMGRNEQDDKMMGQDGSGCQMMGRCGQGGEMMERDGSPSGRFQGACSEDGAGRNMFRGHPAALLMGDLNAEDLNNMTVSQVRDLIQTKMQELDNMTLSQIKQLNLENTQKMENMTLTELKEEKKNRQEVAGILSLAAFRPQPEA